MFAAERSPQETPQARDILALVDDMVPEGAEELAYDEPENGDDSVRRIDVGLMWNVDPDQLRDGESVRICICNEEGRYNLGALLNKQHGVEALPLSFIELKREKKGASFSSMVYVLENGDITALVDTYIDGDDALSEESEDCYDFADQLGFGALWTRALYRSAEETEAARTSEFLALDDEQKRSLHTFLNSLADRV